MRKYLLITLSLLTIVALLAACGPKETEVATEAPVEITMEDCPKAEVFCVGLVTDVGKIDDKSFNQSTWEGVQLTQDELGVDIVQYIETTDSKDYGKNIAQFGDAGFDVIVTVGFGLGEATLEAGPKYPDVKFIGVDQFQGDVVENVVGLIFPEDQSGFLAGALAAQMSESGKLGAVLGTDAVPPVWRFGEGYRAGAQYINPDIEVNVVYHNDVGFDKTFTDPEWGKTTALSMIDKGVDVIFGAGGKTGNGALLGCAEKGVLAIGVDTDQYYTVPEAQSVLLTSAMKLLTPGTFDLIKMAKEGNFPAGGNYLGAAGLAPYHDLADQVPDDVDAKIQEIDAALKDGSLETGVAPVKPE
ncbi:MAG: BMP family ABC transporter substrate-binding protein [Chloroflexi bacterium]|nr:MAG: BMP family ABC transporter substrate-binding protein [Chloroflexota bacterium]